MAKEFVCTSSEPIVQTKQGRLRGFRLGSTYNFYGVKYANAKRWQMPTPVEPWEGVKDALSYGYICPLPAAERPDGDIFVPHRFWPKSEDCQYLNIWTQSLDREAKKPVIVWIHGGGYTAGSSLEMVAYDGENMSKYGDAVVVSMNHRLNFIGYFDVSAFGEKYENSGNLGQADLVLCLKWIRDNIAAFGGDPDNVTLFGQSGGGRKIGALLQMPAADGLFHKAIIQSGVVKDTLRVPDASQSKEIVQAVMEKLGVDDFEVLANEVSYDDIAKAMNAVLPAFREKGVSGMIWGPHKGDYYLGDIRDGNPVNEHAKTIPTIIGTTYAEGCAFSAPKVAKYDLSEEEREKVVRERLGEKADELIPLFRAAYPEKSLVDLAALDNSRRWGTLDYLKYRAVYPQAPIYTYVFSFDFPINDGTAAWHCAEIPFAFHNTDKVALCNVPGVTEKVEDAVFGAWVNFARTGDPSPEGLCWKPFTLEEKNTMVFDKISGLRTDYDTELIEKYVGETVF